MGPLFITARKARSPRRADLTADGHARLLSYRQADTLWKKYTPGWDLRQLRHTAISARAAHGYNEIELKRFSGHLSLRSREVYIAHNREAAKSKARAGSGTTAPGSRLGIGTRAASATEHDPEQHQQQQSARTSSGRSATVTGSEPAASSTPPWSCSWGSRWTRPGGVSSLASGYL